MVRILDVCWWEGVADEARRGMALRGGGLGPLPLGDGALQKDFLKGRESDLHFRNNILGTCIKKRREDYRNLEVNEVDQ